MARLHALNRYDRLTHDVEAITGRPATPVDCRACPTIWVTGPLDETRRFVIDPPSTSWQAYFREYQPPMLIAWGKNDQIFPAAGAEPYKRNLKTLEFHLLDAGHFALETNGDEIAQLMRDFLDKHVGREVTSHSTALRGTLLTRKSC